MNNDILKIIMCKYKINKFSECYVSLNIFLISKKEKFDRNSFLAILENKILENCSPFCDN